MDPAENTSSAWLPVATGEQLAASGGMLAVRLLDTPWVLVRLDGAVTALLDRCPHRRVPLSAGQVVTTGNGQQIECGYHGWRFDGSGTCTSVPALGFDAPVPKGMRVATAAAVNEAYGVIWLAARSPSTSGPTLPAGFGAGAVLLTPRRMESTAAHLAAVLTPGTGDPLGNTMIIGPEPLGGGAMVAHALRPETTDSTVVYTWVAGASSGSPPPSAALAEASSALEHPRGEQVQRL
jgi:vanillate O-demethylase monooxygenase subunit